LQVLRVVCLPLQIPYPPRLNPAKYRRR